MKTKITMIVIPCLIIAGIFFARSIQDTHIGYGNALIFTMGIAFMLWGVKLSALGNHGRKIKILSVFPGDEEPLQIPQINYTKETHKMAMFMFHRTLNFLSLLNMGYRNLDHIDKDLLEKIESSIMLFSIKKTKEYALDDYESTGRTFGISETDRNLIDRQFPEYYDIISELPTINYSEEQAKVQQA